MFALTITLALTPIAAAALIGCESEESTTTARATTAEEVVAHHLEAIGGEARWKSIQTLAIHGAIRRGGETQAFHSYRARPNKLRKEGMHDGKPYTKIFDGSRGFRRADDGSFEALPAEYAAKMASHAEFDDVLIDYARRGTKVELVGIDEVKGAPAYHLALTLASGDVEHRYLDRTTFLDLEHRTTYRDKEGHEKAVVSTFSDWREVGGIKINFAAETEHDGERSTLVIEAVKVDEAIDPALFSAAAKVSAAWP